MIRAATQPETARLVAFTADALLGACADKMPRYMVPKAVEVLNELPKTSSGKVDYPALRRREGL